MFKLDNQTTIIIVIVIVLAHLVIVRFMINKIYNTIDAKFNNGKNDSTNDKKDSNRKHKSKNKISNAIKTISQLKHDDTDTGSFDDPTQSS